METAARDLGCHLILEPGRAVVGPAGVLLTRVLVSKRGLRNNFLVVDAGMNDLLRPALYGARHRILPVRQKRAPTQLVDVVGPLCETGDTFAQNLRLPRLKPGDLVAICDVGAYGFVLRNPRAYAAPIPMRGMLGLFDVTLPLEATP